MVGGRNTQIEVRFATKPEQARACAQELITQQPDVILASTTPAAIALQRETRTIPIIFVGVADPIGAGLITNLARPGANLSGLLSYEDTIRENGSRCSRKSRRTWTGLRW